ncbi:MAG TPA: DNA polymerase [Nannocystaceae bacterium]|nr:DNA polymerase [Nannocystaceae bacterium]
MDALGPASPPWPTPAVRIVDTHASAIDIVAAWARAQPSSIALAVVAVRPGPWADIDDHRVGEVWAIALARAATDDDPHVVVLTAAALDAVPHLLDWLGGDDAPYVVIHGAQAALGRLAAWREGWSPRRLGCTRTAAVLLAEGTRGQQPHELAECVEKVLGRSLATPRRIPGEEHDGLVQCGAVADAVLALAPALVPMLRKRELVPSFQLECELLPAVVDMERAGMPCDAAAFERIAASWRDERARTEQPERQTRLDKLISTYAHWPRDFVRADRIHCRLHPLAADSGRFSCTDPNLQQVPTEHTAPGLRACFHPAPGRVLVIADYAQIELRVAAQLAPCDALAAVFERGSDPHLATAATLTGKPEAEVTAHERKLAKAVNFGFLFGMGADRFRDYARDGYGVVLDDVEARRARQAFFTTFPGISAWHRRTADRCRGSAAVLVRTVLGRRKRFAEGRASVPAALNIPVQGTAAEGFKRALVQLRPALARIGARGVMCVHDEYIAEAPREGAEEARALVAETMRAAMASVVTRVPIVVEARVADAWG